jgi:hypothetical protein
VRERCEEKEMYGGKWKAQREEHGNEEDEEG